MGPAGRGLSHAHAPRTLQRRAPEPWSPGQNRPQRGVGVNRAFNSPHLIVVCCLPGLPLTPCGSRNRCDGSDPSIRRPSTASIAAHNSLCWAMVIPSGTAQTYWKFPVELSTGDTDGGGMNRSTKSSLDLGPDIVGHQGMNRQHIGVRPPGPRPHQPDRPVDGVIRCGVGVTRPCRSSAHRLAGRIELPPLDGRLCGVIPEDRLQELLCPAGQRVHDCTAFAFRAAMRSRCTLFSRLPPALTASRTRASVTVRRLQPSSISTTAMMSRMSVKKPVR